jgi:hypothetical protein
MSQVPIPDFTQLAAHFWQLDAAQRFSASATRLYFYWLHHFGSGGWPAGIARRSSQVAAALGLPEKVLTAARVALVGRGLLDYEAGTKTRAATWHLLAQSLDSHALLPIASAAVMTAQRGGVQ